ncbi:MAG: LysM domain-containing protein, partial [Akkermansiaceae bacterium]
AAASPASPASPASTASTGKTYQIRSGDTYSRIAHKQKVSVASLIAANPSVKPNALLVGQTIHLDAATSSPAIASPPAPKPLASAANTTISAPKAPAPVTETAAAAAVETPSATSDQKFLPITIDGEMTYGDFASQYGTDTDRLNALNGLDLRNTTVLAKGSELYVPAQP